MSPNRGWSYSTGERGRNRVRAFAHDVTGRMFLEFTDSGKKRRVALKHYDPEAAKVKAEELAAQLRKRESPLAAAPTLQTLFDIYVREVTPQKSRGAQSHDRRARALFLHCFGANCKPDTLNRRDWDRFIGWRRDLGDGRTGKVRGGPVRDRIIVSDLKSLQAVLNWATTARDERGQVLLVRNPLKGMPWPRERAPRQPRLSDAQVQGIRAVAQGVGNLFALAFTLAYETGHRIGSILKLRWSDVLFDKGSIRWRGENDKIGLEQETAASEEAMRALRQARTERPTIGEVWVFPSPSDASKPCSRNLARDWWQQAEKAASVEHVPGLGWHSLRRRFATDFKHLPLVDQMKLGGWVSPQVLVTVYHQSDEHTVRTALANRHRESTPKGKTGTDESPA